MQLKGGYFPSLTMKRMIAFESASSAIKLHLQISIQMSWRLNLRGVSRNELSAKNTYYFTGSILDYFDVYIQYIIFLRFSAFPRQYDAPQKLVYFALEKSAKSL